MRIDTDRPRRRRRRGADRRATRPFSTASATSTARARRPRAWPWCATPACSVPPGHAGRCCATAIRRDASCGPSGCRSTRAACAAFAADAAGLLAHRPSHAGAGGRRDDHRHSTASRSRSSSPTASRWRSSRRRRRSARARSSSTRWRRAYLFGPPAANLPVETRVRLVDSTFTAKGFEASPSATPSASSTTARSSPTTGKLDEEGRSELRGHGAREGARCRRRSKRWSPRASRSRAGAVSRRSRRMQVHPYPYYLGLRQLGGERASPSREAGRAGVRGGGAGRRRGQAGARRRPARRPLRGPLQHGAAAHPRRRLPLRVDPRGGAARQPAVPGGQGARHLPVHADPLRQLPRGADRLRDSRPRPQVEFYAAGWGMSPWAIKNPARLELDLDKEEYAPGDTAVVQVRAPFAGKLLVTVERDRVLDTQVHHAHRQHRHDRGADPRRVPAQRLHHRRRWCAASRIWNRARPAARSAPCRCRSTGPPTSWRRRSPSREEIRPDTQLEIGVRTAPGAVVTVAAVDEGILQLIAQKTPQPFDWFYRRLGLSVTSFDTFSLLLPEVAKQGKAAGRRRRGRGGPRPSTCAPTASAGWSRWPSGPGRSPPDGSGNVKVSFQVPEFQGALRVMAVAVDGRALRLVRGQHPGARSARPAAHSAAHPLVRRDAAGAGDGAQRHRPGRLRSRSVSPPRDRRPACPGRRAGHADRRDPGRPRADGLLHGQDRRRGGRVPASSATAAGNGEQSRSVATVGIRADLPRDLGGGRGRRRQVGRWTCRARRRARFRPETVRRELRIGPLPLIQFAGKLERPAALSLRLPGADGLRPPSR